MSLGLVYNYFRDYDPSIGRYIESDLVGLRGGINTYAYVNANPLRKIDVFGLWSVQIEAYNFFGGGFSVSYDKGTLEVLGRLGVGFGGGFSYNPTGTPSPHSKKCGNGLIARASYKASAGFHFLPFGIEKSFTLAEGNAFTDKVGGGYTENEDIAFTADDHDMSSGLSWGVSAGADIGSYINLNQDQISCGCNH